ncbi:MAG: head GIN domain-containing protein [Bacteroidota bacterium]
MKLLLPVFSFSLVIFTSCNIGGEGIRGNGVIKTETRDEKGFESIEINGAIKVFVKQDSAYSVKVEADENLQQHIEVYMNKNTLIIGPENGYNLKPSQSVKVYVSGPSLRRFDVSGASSIESEGRITSADELYIDLSGASEASMDVKSPLVGVEVSGASSATLSGETKDLRVDGTGASKAKCFDLMAENVQVKLSGASHAQVFASVKLKADASGASHIKYKGNAEVTQETSGAGSVGKVETLSP